MRNGHAQSVFLNDVKSFSDRRKELRKMIEETSQVDEELLGETVYYIIRNCSDLDSEFMKENKKDKFEYGISTWYNELYILEEAFGGEFVGRCLSKFIEKSPK